MSVSTRRTVLYADDESSILGLAALCLEIQGLEALTASTGEEAVELFEQNHESIAVVMLDLNMPGMDGDEVAHMIRERVPFMPIILVSGYPKEDVEERLDLAPFAGYLQKPFTLDTLTQSVTTVLSVHR